MHRPLRLPRLVVLAALLVAVPAACDRPEDKPAVAPATPAAPAVPVVTPAAAPTPTPTPPATSPATLPAAATAAPDVALRPLPFEPFTEEFKAFMASIEMVPIKGGTFRPSSPDGTPGAEVTVGDFFISKTEVPWELYDVFALGLDQTLAEKAQDDLLDKPLRSRPSPPYGAPDFGFGHNGYAALCVSHKSATSFCQWLSAKTGKRYRLPTEAEWEYAARAGSAASAPADLDEVAWHKGNADEGAKVLATRKPNAFGLHDMLGNVAEWCDGADGRPVVRGGSWRTRARDLTFAWRQHQTPAWQERDCQIPQSTWWLSEGDFIGFRIVCETLAPER